MPAAPATTRSKDYYLALRGRFAPKEAKIIYVLESPPASGKYFYDPSGSTKEPLFTAIMNDVLGIKPPTKEKGLQQFAGRGFFLIDSTYTPVNRLKDKARDAVICGDFTGLVEDLKRYAQSHTGIVLVKANVCRLLGPRLTAAGFNVLNAGEVIPFPSNGQQGKFRAAIRRVLGPRK